MERGNHFHRRPHSGQSITHQTAPILHTREYFQKKESAALGQIPGVKELLNAYDDERPALEKKYPDATFALNISSNLFFHDKELTDIHMKAYSSILKGDPIADVHFRYEKEVDAYRTRPQLGLNTKSPLWFPFGFHNDLLPFCHFNFCAADSSTAQIDIIYFLSPPQLLT